MKKCIKCNLLVDSKHKTCPLCGEELELINDESNRQNYPSYEAIPVKKNILLRVFIFLTIVVDLISILIDFLTYKEGGIHWSSFPIASTIYLWILIRFTILSKRNAAFKLLIQMITVSLVVFVIDIYSKGGGWALNYVIPFLSMASTLMIAIILMARRMKFSSYVFNLFASIILGFIPFILWLTGIVTVNWPSLSAACFSLLTLIGMILFANEEIKEEIKKKFNI